MHWHGILVPWDNDGPSYSNNFPIKPKETFTFNFPIRQTGTYWYHSHTGLQEQRGLYGAFIIEDDIPSQQDQVLILSDFSFEKPTNILKNIKKSGHYYSFKKKFFPSLFGAIKNKNLLNFLHSTWTGMGAMDLSDVGYDYFLINGKTSSQLNFKSQSTVRFRVINAGSSTHFYLHIGQLRYFKIISKDGMKIKPLQANEIFLGPGETYDLLFKMPQHKSVELKATAQDITGSARVILGQGPLERAYSPPKPNPYDSSHYSHTPASSSKNQLKKNKSTTQNTIHPIKYSQLEALTPSSQTHQGKTTKFTLKLVGNMDRYNWSIEGEPFTQTKYIPVKKGDTIQLELVNRTMMNHPMHLHGHFFKLLNGKGKKAPLLHTVDIPPMKTKTIEFVATEVGMWFFHCHNLYHMYSGMSRFVKYKGFKRPRELVEAEQKARSFLKNIFFLNSFDFYSNFIEVSHKTIKNNWNLQWEGEIDLHLKSPQKIKHQEARMLLKRYYGFGYLSFLGGLERKQNASYGLMGLGFRLPLHLDTEIFLKYPFSFWLRLHTEIPLAPKLKVKFHSEIDYGSSTYSTTFKTFLTYQIGPALSIGILHKSEHDQISWGIGLSGFF